MTVHNVRDEESYKRFLEYVTESGLEPEIRTICRRHAVTLRDIYLDVRGPTVYAARLEVWWWLASAYRKSTSEIGRLFDREATSVLYAIRRLREASIAMGIELDAGTAHDMAKRISEKITKVRSEQGVQHAQRMTQARLKKTSGNDEP